MKAWRKFENDFNAMSDNDIIDENRRMEDQLAAAEDWLEAVAAWEADGRPRGREAETEDEEAINYAVHGLREEDIP